MHASKPLSDLLTVTSLDAEVLVCQVTFPVMPSQLLLVCHRCLISADLGKLEVPCAVDATLNLGVVCMIVLVDTYYLLAY